MPDPIGDIGAIVPQGPQPQAPTPGFTSTMDPRSDLVRALLGAAMRTPGGTLGVPPRQMDPGMIRNPVPLMGTRG